MSSEASEPLPFAVDQIPIFRKALGICPDNLQVRLGLVAALDEAGRFAEAHAELEVCRELAPTDPRVTKTLAKQALFDGNFEGATALLQPLLSEDTEAVRILTTALRQQGNLEEALRWAEQGLERAPQSARFSYELGHIHHRLGDYPKAWQYFVHANGIARPPEAPRRARMEAEYQALVAGLERLSTPSTAQPIGGQAPTAIYVVGALRSGTTLLTQNLARRIDCRPVGESSAVSVALCEVLRNPPYLDLARIDPSGSTALVQLFVDLQGPHGTLGFPEGRRALARATERLDPPPIEGLRLDKMPSNAWRMPFIQAADPRAHFVHMVRDGREVAFSAFTQDFAQLQWHSYDIEDALADWMWTIRFARLAHEKYNLRYHEVRYEDLVCRPQATLDRLLSELNLLPDPAQAQKDRTPPPVRTASYAQVSRPIYQHSVHKCRNYPEVYAQLTRAGAPLLGELGYCP